MLLRHDASPIHVIDVLGRKVYVKREDQLAAICTGNKYRKLKYNLIAAAKASRMELLSFGGAFSNHLVALSMVGKRLNLPTIGIVRGEEDVNNPSIRRMKANGMMLNFVSRSEYRKRHQANYLDYIRSQYPAAFIIPEGGSNHLALQGLSEMVREVEDAFDYWVVAVGTGATAAGILCEIQDSSILIAINVLKGIDQRKSILSFVPSEIKKQKEKQLQVYDGALGGYGRKDPRIDNIMNRYMKLNLPLDPIYTAKAMLGLEKLFQEKRIDSGASILFVHTGGLQGLEGYTYRYNNPSNTSG